VDDPQAKEMEANLHPLEKVVLERLNNWLPKLSHPVRIGEHDQTAFALGLMLDYAHGNGDQKFAELVVSRAKQFYISDKNCPLAYEPSGEDFLSPCLGEADVMRRVLPSPEFARWLRTFLPQISTSGNLKWLQPVVSPDPRGAPPSCHFAYQSECADHRLHERHCVEVHWRSLAGALRWAQSQPRMDAGGSRCWFTEERQAAAVDHGDRRGAQAGWFGCCDRRALRGRSLAGELRGLSGHETRHLEQIKIPCHTLQWLKLDFADLNERLGVRVLRDVFHGLLRVRAEARLKGLN